MRDLEEMADALRARLVLVMADVTVCAAQASALGVVLRRSSEAVPPSALDDVAWRSFEQADLTVPHTAPSVVTSGRACVAGNHEVVRLWVRGGLAGELTVSVGDADVIMGQLGLREVARGDCDE